MKKVFVHIMAVLAMTFMLTGCDTSIVAPPMDNVVLGDALIHETSKDSSPEETGEEPVESTIEEAEPVDTTKYDEDGMEIVRSYLTGRPIRLDERQKRPLAIMMNNIKEGCPQSGIAQASIVYEAPVEGRITRLMGIFERYDDIPEKIGSVRSSRDYFVYLSTEYDAIYAHFGQATFYVGELLNSDSVDNISGAVSGINNPAHNSFYRSSDRKAPHNVYLNREGFWQDLERFGYRKELSENVRPKFAFPEEGTRVEYENYPEATVLYPGGKEKGLKNGFSNVEARFEYNPADKKYYRYEYGAEQIDKEDGNQLAYDNVIFQYCHGEVRDENDYLAFGLHGEWNLKVQIFTNGRVVDGLWTRGSESFNTPTVYKDLEGNPIEINEGKTWICIIWDEYSQDVVIE